MSSAQNHRARSHRSEFRKGPYRASSRMSIGTPTLHKNHFAQFIRQIRQAGKARRREAQGAEPVES